MDSDLIGRTIGKYEIIARLGAGGMASVYRARDAENKRDVAIKILPIHLAANEKLRRRFIREAQTAARLQHPHILPIYDFGEDRGTPYIVMKLVEGGTLDTILEIRGLLPFRLVARVISQVSQALDYAHSQDVIHRDLKPENILFDATGSAYLGDFGIARIHESSSSLTGTGGFIGTAAYASPEQCRGEQLTPASDIYSLGVVLYELLTGTLPFTGTTPLAIMHQHMSEPVPNLLRERPDLPMEINDVMRKALAKLPNIRYRTAHAMSVALNTALKRELGTMPLAEKAPPVGPDPVFENASHPKTEPLPMPDDLLRDLSPTNPLRPIKDRSDWLDELSARAKSSQVPDTPTAVPDTPLYLYLLLIALLVIVLVLVILIVT